MKALLKPPGLHYLVQLHLDSDVFPEKITFLQSLNAAIANKEIQGVAIRRTMGKKGIRTT